MALEQETLNALYGMQFFLLFIMFFTFTIAILMVLIWFGLRKNLKQLDEMLRTMQLKLVIEDEVKNDKMESKDKESPRDQRRGHYPSLVTLRLPGNR